MAFKSYESSLESPYSFVNFIDTLINRKRFTQAERSRRFMPNMIEIHNLTKCYPLRDRNTNWKTAFAEGIGLRKPQTIRALDNINVEIEQGEIIGILGPNGAGKTTALKVIAGFLIPEEGEVRVNGCDIISERKKVRVSCNFLRSGGWVIFDYKYPIHRLLEFWGIFMGLRKKEARERIDGVLETVGLIDKKTDFPEHLSAGMRQKLNLARCLMVPRPVYLLDEPTANIDPYSGDFIRKFVKDKLAKEGTTIVLATHNLWEAEMMCDRIVILDKGKVLKIGPAAEIKKAVGEESVVLELESLPEGLLQEIQELSFVVDLRQKEKVLKVYGKDLHRNVFQILDVCNKYTTPKHISMQEPSLNEIFVQLIGEANKEEGEAA